MVYIYKYKRINNIIFKNGFVTIYKNNMMIYLLVLDIRIEFLFEIQVKDPKMVYYNY